MNSLVILQNHLLFFHFYLTVPENSIFFVSHGDCEEDAKYVSELVKKERGIKKYMIHDIGPVIGAHSGPGTVALFFLGQSRTE